MTDVIELYDLEWEEYLASKGKKKATIKLKGGEGSGHFDHAGIPDHHGGSLPSDDKSSGIAPAWSQVDRILESGKYDNFKSGDMKSYVSKHVNELMNKIGLKTDVKFISDAEFATKFKNVKISSDASKLGMGANSISSAYVAGENCIYLKDSAVNAISDAASHTAVLSTLYHELGHAYHANVLGVTTVGKGNYASSWPEEFASGFGATLTYGLSSIAAKKSPEKYMDTKMARRHVLFNTENELNTFISNMKNSK